MRLFKILLFFLISGAAFGQAGASMMMTTAESGGATYLLDDYPADAAYSLRLLKADQIDSAAIRVRRDSDNAEQDIGFTSEGYLDTASLKTFVGANSGYVVTWYDQSGNENDATQSTAANQPRIINAGTVDRLGGLPCIVADGTNDFLQSSATGWSTLTNTLNCIVASFNRTGDANDWLFGYSNGGYVGGKQWSGLRQLSGNNNFVLDGTSNVFIDNGTTDTNQHLFIGEFTGATSIELSVDGSNATNSILVSVGFSPNQEIDIFAADNSGTPTAFCSASLQEAIVYITDQSANRTAIESQINTHYSIY